MSRSRWWLRLLKLEEMTLIDVVFFLDSCKIKRDVIQELGEGVSIVQVKGRGMWDKEKEASVRKAQPDSLGGGLAGSPWG